MDSRPSLSSLMGDRPSLSSIMGGDTSVVDTVHQALGLPTKPTTFQDFKNQQLGNTFSDNPILAASKQGWDQGMSQEADLGIPQRLWNTGAQAVGGALNAAGGIVDANIGFYKDLGNIGNQAIFGAKADPHSYGIEGVNKMIGGAMQMAGAPLEMSPTIKETLGATFNGAREGMGQLLQEHAGIDPTSTRGKDILDSFMNAGAAALAAHGIKAEGPLTVKGAMGAVEDTFNGLNDAASKLTPEGIKNKIAPVDFQKEAIRAGINDKHIGQIQNFTPEEAASQKALLEGAKARIENPKAPSVYRMASDEFQQAYNKLKQLKVKSGVELGKVKKDMAENPIEPTPIKNDMSTVLDEQNAIKNGKLNLADSALAGSGAETLVSNLWNKLSGKEPIRAGDIEALTSQIENKIGPSPSQIAKSTPAGQALVQIKGAINGALGKAHEAFGAANSKFAELADGLKAVEDAAKLKKVKGETSLSTPRAFARLLTSTPEKANAGLSALVDLAEKNGIKLPRNFVDKAHQAALAEHYAGPQQPRSMEGITTKAAASIPGNVGKAAGLIDKGLNWINPKMKSIESINNVIKMIDRAQEIKKSKS